MGLLLALGLRPLASRGDVVPDTRPEVQGATGATGPAATRVSPGAGRRDYAPAPARISQSQRTFIRDNLVTSPLATSVQGDVSARLGHKAAGEATIAGRAKALAGLDAANYKRLRDAAQSAVDALDAHAAKASVATSIRDAKAKLTASDAANAAGKRGDASGVRPRRRRSAAVPRRWRIRSWRSARPAMRCWPSCSRSTAWMNPTRSRSSSGSSTMPTPRPRVHPPTCPTVWPHSPDQGGLAIRIKMVVDEERARLAHGDRRNERRRQDGRRWRSGRGAASHGSRRRGARQGRVERLPHRRHRGARLLGPEPAHGRPPQRLRHAARHHYRPAGQGERRSGDPGTGACTGRAGGAGRSARRRKSQKFEEGQRTVAEVAVRCQAWLDASASIGEVNTTVAAVDKAIVELAPGRRRRPEGPSRLGAGAARRSGQDADARQRRQQLARGVESALAAARHASQDIAQAKALADALKASQKVNAAGGQAHGPDGPEDRAQGAACRSRHCPRCQTARGRRGGVRESRCGGHDTDAALAKKRQGRGCGAVQGRPVAAHGRTVAVAQAQFDTSRPPSTSGARRCARCRMRRASNRRSTRSISHRPGPRGERRERDHGLAQGGRRGRPPSTPPRSAAHSRPRPTR